MKEILKDNRKSQVPQQHNIDNNSEKTNMDDSTVLVRSAAFIVAGYPLYLARTLIQLGYEPVPPDNNGYLPNIFSYISIIREQRGYLALYTGIRYYSAAVLLKQTSYDLMASVTSHKTDKKDSDVSEIIAVCLRESALKIQSTIITYPLLTLSVGYISAAFFGTKETVEFTVGALYKGVIPKLIIEVTMVWVSIISRRITASLVDDELGQAIISRVPPFIIQSFLYPFNVVATVMADNGISGKNPKFDNWRSCYDYLTINNQLKRGSSLFYRRDYQTILGSKHSIKRYF